VCMWGGGVQFNFFFPEIEEFLESRPLNEN